MANKRPIRYGRPDMTNLPPQIARMIIDAIRNPPPFDYSKLDLECELAEKALGQMGRENNDAKSVVAGK